MCCRLAAICLVLAAAGRCLAGDPPPDASRVRARLPQLLAELDSARFDVRQRAANEVEAWLVRSELTPVLADEFAKRLVDPRLSYEVRWRLERWSSRLPASRVPPTIELTNAEIERLLDQLDDDSFAVRAGATRRVQWLSGDSRVVGPLLAGLKRRLATPTLSAEARQRLDPLTRQVRVAWLTSDPTQWRLPPVPDEQIRAWVDTLARPADTLQAASWSAVQQELLDTLARDDHVGRVSAILRGRLAQAADRDVAARLDAVLDWTRPAMVAEFWQGRRHLGEQHLIVGEPSQAEGAPRPSHFDRIDDRVAHCVSGSNLSPGDYPTGIAFLHPQREEAFFHLVNLPSPRRRMAYSHYVKLGERTRLAHITRRTVERFEADHRMLSSSELKVLDLLDLALVSGFAGRYLATVKPQAGRNASASVEYLAVLLAEQGTAEAGAGLVRAIERAESEPWPQALRQAMWHAGLAVTARNPWPKADAWLAERLGRTDLLDDESTAQLGATAAALLLARHHEPLARFGLRPTGPLAASPDQRRQPEVQGYRFTGAESAAEIARWWKNRPRT